MSLETGIFNWLASQDAITDVVGSRIWRNKRQTSDLPCLTYSRIAEHPIQGIRKSSQTTVYDIQFDVYSLDDEDTVSVLASLKSLLNGFHGSIDEIHVKNIKLRGIHNTTFSPQDGTGVFLYKRTGDFTFKVTE